MKINEQKEQKQRNEKKKKEIQAEFSKHANKDRLQSVNVFLPSKIGF